MGCRGGGDGWWVAFFFGVFFCQMVCFLLFLSLFYMERKWSNGNVDGNGLKKSLRLSVWGMCNCPTQNLHEFTFINMYSDIIHES